MIWELFEPMYLLKTTMFLQRYVYALTRTCLKVCWVSLKQTGAHGVHKKRMVSDSRVIYGPKVPNPESPVGRRDTHSPCLWGPRSRSALRLAIAPKLLLRKKDLSGAAREIGLAPPSHQGLRGADYKYSRHWRVGWPVISAAAGGTNLSVRSVGEQPDHSRGIKELFLLRDIRKSDLAFSYSVTLKEGHSWPRDRWVLQGN